MRMRMGSVVVLMIAIIGLASSATACETCPADSFGVKRCSSGHASGSQSCSGGSGVPCNLVGSCGTGGGPGGGVQHPESSPIRPCLICVGDAPDQGFVLRQAVAQSTDSAASLVRSEPARPEASAEPVQRD